MSAHFAAALPLVLDPAVLGVVALAALLGILVGAMPGLTAVMGVALLVPFTFHLDPLPAVAAVVTLAATAIFAGDIPGILLRIPGTPASAAYAEDGHQMAMRGEPHVALSLSMAGACAGGIIGVTVLVMAAPALARAALQFSSFEYFWLALLGLCCAALVSSSSARKGATALCLGLLLSTVGLDETAGSARFTFDSTNLIGGVNFIAVLIGLFALPAIIRGFTQHTPAPRFPDIPFRALALQLRKNTTKLKINMARGGLLGAAVGALPGAGADIAAWIAYAVSRKLSKTPEKFGAGGAEGIAEAGAANNGALSGAYVPALVFGVPGDSITAVVIGVLYLKGLQPGPTIFLNQADMVYAIFIIFFLANLALLPLGLIIARLARRLLMIPRAFLAPVVLAFASVGAYAINNSAFDIGVMLVAGMVGYVLEENRFPLAPIILGMVLGGMVEFNFVTSMIKVDGDLTAFFSRPIAAALGVATIAAISIPAIRLVLSRRG